MHKFIFSSFALTYDYEGAKAISCISGRCFGPGGDPDQPALPES
jgi:hypothetical protein